MPVYNPMLFLILLKIYISINVNTIALLTYIINVYIIAILYIYRSLLEDYEFLRVLPVPSYKDMHCANLRVCAARISTS